MLNKTEKSSFGILGEREAIKYLLAHQYKIIAQNYLIRFDEIDIITKHHDGTLVFCEVKTMRSRINPSQALTPEDNLTILKYRKMARSAQIFANKYPGHINEEKGWRIDLIAVVLDDANNLVDLRHYENI